MNIVLLGGNHKLNKEWVDEIAENIKDVFEKVVVQDFYHWKDEDGMIDLEKEANQLAQIVKDWEDYIVFAKSAGAIVAIKDVFEKRISPKKLILVGFPYEWAKEKGWEVDRYLEDLKIPTLFIQKPHDWAMAYDDLVRLLESKVGAEYRSVKYAREGEPDNDHHYADIKYLKSLIQEFTDES